MAITTHILDTSRGCPAAGVLVLLEVQGGDGSWGVVGRGTTDADGRQRALMSTDQKPQVGRYRLTFATASYFGDAGGFYPEVSIVFNVLDPEQHYHVPLLLSPYGYTTYRGS